MERPATMAGRFVGACSVEFQPLADPGKDHLFEPLRNTLLAELLGELHRADRNVEKLVPQADPEFQPAQTAWRVSILIDLPHGVSVEIAIVDLVQKLPVVAEEHSQPLGDGEDHLAVGDVLE